MEKFQKVNRQHSRLTKNMSRSTRRACIRGIRVMERNTRKRGMKSLFITGVYNDMIDKFKF